MARIAYKLCKRRHDGSLGSLFINARRRLPVGQWMDAEDHPTRCYAHRPGWHCTIAPEAPHLALHPKNGPRRVWCRVEVDDVETFERPASQGGQWLLAKRMRILEVL